jgi:antitoxin component YwqK of YwqJK toxin-antitoxin module
MRYLAILLFSISLFACNSKTTTGSSDANLSGFQIEDVEGTNYKKASRVGSNGVILEEGTLLNGNRNGQWINYHPNNSDKRIKTFTQYIDGKKTGVELVFNTRGQIESKANYLNDEYHGLVAEYKFGRPTQETEYKNGKYHGVHREYYQRGEVQKEVEFKDGKQHGSFKYYDEEGNVTLEYTYKNGEKVSGGMKE